MSFIDGLREAKHIYAECPNCQFIFSLFNARLMYGKDPPKDQLAKVEKQIRNALDKIQAAEAKYKDVIEKLEYKRDDDVDRLKTKYNMAVSEHRAVKQNLAETIRHLKNDIAASQKEIIKEKTAKAIQSSRGAIEGHIAELFPFFGKTPYNPGDLCTLMPRQPVDFVVFNGMFQNDIKSITFLDVKTGKAQFGPIQRQIRGVVEEGKVEMKRLKVKFDVKGSAEADTPGSRPRK